MAGLGAKVGDDLRDFSNSPTDEAYESKGEGEFVTEITETVFEILVNPTHTWFPLFYTKRN